MSLEDIQAILAEVNTQFNDLRKDLNHVYEKLSDKISIQSEISISTSKDIEAVRLLFDERYNDLKKDVDSIATMTRGSKESILYEVDNRIKKAELKTRLIVATMLISGLGTIIVLLIKRFL